MKNLSLSETELNILQVLWDAGKALSRPQILAGMPEDKQWNPNSIHQVLNSMMKKGVLEVEGMVQCGRIYGRTYVPTITREEYITDMSAKVLPDSPPKKRLLGIVSALTNQESIDEETITELEGILERRRKELAQRK